MEVDVEQHVAGTIALDVKRHIIVHLVHGEPYVECLPQFVVGDDAYVGDFLLLLHR